MLTIPSNARKLIQEQITIFFLNIYYAYVIHSMVTLFNLRSINTTLFWPLQPFVQLIARVLCLMLCGKPLVNAITLKLSKT